MIAITKEFKQLLQELFDTRRNTEISAKEIVEVLDVSLNDLKKYLKEDSIRNEYKILKARNGDYFVKRFLHGKLEGKIMVSDSKIKWDNIGGCPCFTCYELDKCDIGNPISSVDCPLFSKWLFAEPKESMEEE